MFNGGIVKVSDHGLAEDMYDLNYYRHNSSEVGERVPIRWMAPESINSNVYDEAIEMVSINYNVCIRKTMSLNNIATCFI